MRPPRRRDAPREEDGDAADDVDSAGEAGDDQPDGPCASSGS